MYLSQYRLRVFHKNEKSNIIFDALFRLFIKKQNVVDTTIDNLNINVFNIETTTNTIEKFLIKITKKFRFKLIKNYKKNLF